MTSPRQSLSQFLDSSKHQSIDRDLLDLIAHVAHTCVRINGTIQQGAIDNLFGSVGTDNVQGEAQQKLDVFANEILINMDTSIGQLAGMASEEMDTIIVAKNLGKYLLLFDPLDGSSNIDVNVSIGTIFSVLKSSPERLPTEADFLQKGSQQVAAGYVIYGPQTILVLTLGLGVDMFTLNTDSGTFLLTTEHLHIPSDTQEFAINMSNMRHWAPPVQQYVSECIAGVTGARNKNFNMRWVASMVADVHRILVRGGIFLYPWDQREPEKAGKLRLMYEANPMSFLIEQAGGAAINGTQRILEITPQKLHERVAVMLGSKNEVARLMDFHLN